MLTPTVRIAAAGLALVMLLGGLIAAPFAGFAGIWATTSARRSSSGS